MIISAADSQEVRRCGLDVSSGAAVATARARQAPPVALEAPHTAPHPLRAHSEPTALSSAGRDTSGPTCDGPKRHSIQSVDLGITRAQVAVRRKIFWSKLSIDNDGGDDDDDNGVNVCAHAPAQRMRPFGSGGPKPGFARPLPLEGGGVSSVRINENASMRL